MNEPYKQSGMKKEQKGHSPRFGQPVSPHPYTHSHTHHPCLPSSLQWLQLQPGSRSGVSGSDGHQDSGEADVSGSSGARRSLHQPHLQLRTPRTAPWSHQGQQAHLLPGVPEHCGGLPGLQQSQRSQAAGAALHPGTDPGPEQALPGCWARLIRVSPPPPRTSSLQPPE